MDFMVPKLNRTGLLFILFIAITVMSCGESISNQGASIEGFTAIQNELKDKFGANAYYTDLDVSYDASIGNMITVTVTEDPTSLKMQQWINSKNSWKQNSEITLEVPKGTKAEDYMFQLNETINLSKLGGMIEQSTQKLKDEKNLKNPTLSIAGLNFPKNGDIAKAEYMINLKPENGGTTFRFYYKLNGDLIKMDY